MTQAMEPASEDSKNFRMPMTFDGKRMRKAVLRKTVDYNASIIKQIQEQHAESRVAPVESAPAISDGLGNCEPMKRLVAQSMRKWFKDLSKRNNMQPDESYSAEVLPPSSLIENPINAITTKFVRTSTNKLRCPIFCVVWTPEGRRLVTGASSGEFTLWNGLTFNFETILQAHETPVRAMVWSHSDAWLVSSDHGGYIKYWQSNMNNVKMYEAHKEPIRGLSFSPVDNKFASCSDDGLVKVWDFLRCTEEKVLRGHGADVKCLDWHPHKSLLVSGSKDNQQPIKLWDPRTGSGLATLHAHKSTVMSIKWNQNGNWLLTASRDHLIKLFDIRMMKEMQTFRGHKREATTVAWHPVHETLFASGGSDGSLMFWLVGAEKDVGNMEAAHEGMVWSLAWHPLGHILCSGSNDHSSKFWTRNRLGDKMRDKYNLNLQYADDEMGESETSSSVSSSSHTLAIPGMDATLTASDIDYPEFDGYDAADQAAKQRNMAKKTLTSHAPAWPPASGAQNGVSGIGPGPLLSQIPGFRAPVVRPINEGRGAGFNQVPSEPFATAGPNPARPRPENRGSMLRPDAPTFKPDLHHNSRDRMRTQFEPSLPQRFGGPDYGARRPEDDFGQGLGHTEDRSHFGPGPGARWTERRNIKGEVRRPWEDHQSPSNRHPLGPEDKGPLNSHLRSRPLDEYGQEKTFTGSVEERSGEFHPVHGHDHDAQQDGAARDFRPGLLGSPPRGHDSDTRPGLLGPPPQPGSAILGMIPPGATGNPVPRGSLLGPPPGQDQNSGQSGSQRQEQDPRRRSNEQEDGREASSHISFPTNLHSQHPQDLSSRGFRARARGKGLDHQFREDRTENRPSHAQPFAPRSSSRTFAHGPSDPSGPQPTRQDSLWGRSAEPDPRDSQRMGSMGEMQVHGGLVDSRDPSRAGPGRQRGYGASDVRDPRSQGRSGEPPPGLDDSRFLGAGHLKGSFETHGAAHEDHGPHDFRGRNQFPSPARGNSAGPSDSGPGRGPSRGLEQLTLDSLGNQGDGKPSIPSLMSINPIPYPSDEKKFSDRDPGEFRGRKRSADGEGFMEGEPPRERGPPQLLREDDEWRRPPRTQMDGPHEEWRGPPEDWQNGRFSEEHYEEETWPKEEQFRRDDYGNGGPQGKPRGGWRGRGGRR